VPPPHGLPTIFGLYPILANLLANRIMPNHLFLTRSKLIELAEKACHIYERFCPKIPPGKKGWGASGRLDLQGIREMVRPVKGA
jgi:hypothetical protein